MGAEPSFCRSLKAGHDVAVDDACTFSIDLALQQGSQLLADLYLVVLRSLHLAACKGNGAGEIDLAGLHQAAQEDDFLCPHRPYHFALVDGIDVIDLHTDVACRGGSVEDVHFAVLSLGQSLSCLLCAHAEIDFCHLCQSGKTCLELSLLALEDVLEVLGEGHAVEGAHEDSFGLVFRICHNVVGTLAQESEQTALEHEGLDVALRVELASFLFSVSLDTDAQQLAAVASLHHADCSADRANELHFGM